MMASEKMELAAIEASENEKSTSSRSPRPPKSKFQQWLHEKIEWYCRGVVHRPVTGMLAFLALAIFLAAIAFVAFPFDIDTTGTTFAPRTSSIGRREETRVVAEEISRFNPFRSPEDTASIAVPQQTSSEYGLLLLFSVDEDENILTRERIQVVRDMELAIMNAQGFSDVCLLPRDSQNCTQPQSLSSYFFATPIPGCPNVYRPDGLNENIPFADTDDVLLSLITPRNVTTDNSLPAFCYGTAGDCYSDCTEPSPSFADFAVSKSFGFPNDNTSLAPNLASYVTKSQFYFGLPLAGYDNLADRYDEQVGIVEDFVKRTPKISKQYHKQEGVKINLIADIILEEYFWDLIITDTALVSFSIFVVYLYMTFHVSSFFVSSMGMLHVLLSFPIAYLFTQLAMDFGGMGVLNLMSLFIILGIGADDIFIFVDAWKQSEIEVPAPDGKHRRNAKDRKQEDEEENLEWLAERLVWSYVRSAEAMLITSLTTGAAFVMNLTSAVIAIQIFGGFTAFMIAFNFILVISYFPFAVVTHHRFVRHWRYPCFKWCCKSSSSADGANPTTTSSSSSSSGGGTSGNMKSGSKARENNEDGLEKGPVDVPVSQDQNIDEYRALERYFYKVHAPFVFKYRWLIVAVFSIWFCIAMVFAAQLEPSKTPTQWLPSSDSVQQAIDMINEDFARTDIVPQVVVMYGLEVVDLSGVNTYNPNDVGKVSFDESLDPTAPGFQEAFIDICQRFRSEGEFVLDEEVLCPMELFRDYVTDELSMAFPVPTDEFVPLLANFTRYYEANNGPAPDVSGAVATSKQDAVTREDRRLELVEVFQSIRFKLDTPEPELAYMFIVVNTTLSPFSAGSEIRPVYQSWSARVHEENQLQVNKDATLDNALQTASLYIDLETENTLLDAAVVGIAASLSLAFFIILIMTREFLLSVMSIVSIGGVVASLIAAMVMMGWSLSLIESICMTIVVGLSVDYVIHLANAYRESHEHTRFNRVRHALVVMGISVLSASVTTFLAGFVLFFGYIVFFVKFGIFIALTIFFSALWAFGFFMSLAAIAGYKEPHNDFVRFWKLVTCKPQTLALGDVNVNEDRNGEAVVADKLESTVEVVTV